MTAQRYRVPSGRANTGRRRVLGDRVDGTSARQDLSSLALLGTRQRAHSSVSGGDGALYWTLPSSDGSKLLQQQACE